MIDIFKKQRPKTLLGVSFDGQRIEGMVLRRSNGSLEPQKVFSAQLSLDLLTHEPALVGREIQNALEAAGIRERRCAVILPLGWAVALQTKLPELPEEDVASFLQIEAERGFHYAPEALMLATSQFKSPGGDLYATQVGIPRDQLTRLQEVLKAARLIPVTFSLGVTSLQNATADASDGVLALTVEEKGLGLQISYGGGVVALRTIEGVLEAEGPGRKLQTDLVAREIRITLGQLPTDIRERIKKLRVFGRGELARQLADEMRGQMDVMGVHEELVSGYGPSELGATVPNGTQVSPALSLAASYLTGKNPVFEFLPPKVTLVQQFTSKYSSKKLVYSGVAAGAMVFLVLAAFGIQEGFLIHARSKWKGMETQYNQLQDTQDLIRKYRAWGGDGMRCLMILRQLTQAFPEDGRVTAKTIEIRDLSEVTCTGTTQNNQALIATLDKLRAMDMISSVKLDQLRGKAPMQFTFSFRWGKEAQSEH